ncbi:MAG: hypothetical protein KTR33_16125, partial [Gammaproteobacteria bacterium]|nr:hypothetical protein [Gammaproteobacteria bacterium]
MKSLVAVVALASALGVGYWKMQNPEGGIEDAKTQAQSLLDRLGKGVDTVRTGNVNSNSATLPAQAAANEAFSSRLA